MNINRLSNLLTRSLLPVALRVLLRRTRQTQNRQSTNPVRLRPFFIQQPVGLPGDVVVGVHDGEDGAPDEDQ